MTLAGSSIDPLQPIQTQDSLLVNVKDLRSFEFQVGKPWSDEPTLSADLDEESDDTTCYEADGKTYYPYVYGSNPETYREDEESTWPGDVEQDILLAACMERIKIHEALCRGQSITSRLGVLIDSMISESTQRLTAQTMLTITLSVANASVT